MIPPRRILLTIIAAVLIPDALGYFGVFNYLGAHPLWDIKTAVIGATVGTLIGCGLLWARVPGRLALGLVVMGLAGLAAVYGKSRFVASYAEDALAGRLWFYGWIGVAAGLSLVILAGLTTTRQVRA